MIRRVIVLNISEYPGYERLVIISRVPMDSGKGLFEFIIKEDTAHTRRRHAFFFKERVFTVELVHISGRGDNKKLYADKVLMTWVFSTPLKLNNSLVYGLIDAYLDTIKKNGVDIPIDLHKYKD